MGVAALVAQGERKYWTTELAWGAHAQSRIARNQAEAGDMSGALKTASTIADAALKTDALRKIAAEQVKAGDVAGAATTRMRALDAAAAMDFDRSYDKAVAIALIAAERVDSGDLPGVLAWAAAHAADPVAKVSALVGAAAAMLQRAEQPGVRSDTELLPPTLKLF